MGFAHRQTVADIEAGKRRIQPEELVRLTEIFGVDLEHLTDPFRRELDTEVLFVDAPPGLSGAAIELPGLNAILINRSEPAGRRNFDLAHELFHLLTWEAMPPTRVEPREIPRRKGNRVERLAENFAGALLMRPAFPRQGHEAARCDAVRLRRALRHVRPRPVVRALIWSSARRTRRPCVPRSSSGWATISERPSSWTASRFGSGPSSRPVSASAPDQ